MKTQSLNDLKAHVFALENVEDAEGKKIKPLSEDSELFKEFLPIRRAENTFVALRGKEELFEFVNFMINTVSPFKPEKPPKPAKKGTPTPEETAAIEAAKIAAVEDEKKASVAIRESKGAALFNSIITPTGTSLELQDALCASPLTVSTHSTKMNDSSCRHQIVGKRDNCGIDFGVTGCELNNYRAFSTLKKPTTAAILTLEFVLDGKKTNLFKLIGEWQIGLIEDIVDHLISHCPNQELAKSAINDLKALYDSWTGNEGHSSHHECRHQLVFKVGAEGYMALTPTPSYAMLQALRVMSKNFFDRDMSKTYSLRMATNEVGGANAINAGDYNLYVGGKHSLLEAKIPNIYLNKDENPVDAFLDSLTFKKSLFNGSFSIKSEVVAQIISALDAKQNMKSASKLNDLVKNIGTLTTSTIRKAYQLAPKGQSLACSDIEKRYVLGKAYMCESGFMRSRTDVVSELASNYTEHALGLIQNAIEKQTTEEFAFDSNSNQLASALKQCIAKELLNA